MDLFAVLLLLEGHGAEDGREDHAGTVNEGQRLVEADGAVLGIVGNLGRADGEVGGGEIQGGGGAAERSVEVEVGVGGFGDGLAVAAFGLGHGPGDERGGHGREGDEAETLMNLEHLSALVELGLELGVALGLLRGETEIGERGLLRRRRRSGSRGAGKVGWRLRLLSAGFLLLR